MQCKQTDIDKLLITQPFSVQLQADCQCACSMHSCFFLGKPRAAQTHYLQGQAEGEGAGLDTIRVARASEDPDAWWHIGTNMGEAMILVYYHFWVSWPCLYC